MYKVVYKYSYWWISKDDEILVELGRFIDPVSPEIIIKEIENEMGL